MVTFMNISQADIDSFEKCRSYTVSIVECNEIGIQLAHVFADAGFKVIGVDRNPHTLRQIRKGSFRFKGNKTLREYMQEKVFSLSADARQAASSSDIILVAAGPLMDRRGKPDYTQLEEICRNVGMGIGKGSLVLFTNTTGPGKVEGLMREILEKSSGLRAGQDFGLASSPLQINPLTRTPESVAASKSYRFVGGIDEASLHVASIVLDQITKSEIVRVSNIKTVETLNLFHKAKIATSIALANEFALLCNRLNVDFLEVSKATTGDIEPRLLLPGLVSDSVRRATRFLLAEGENLDLQLKLTASSKRINDEIIDYSFRLIKDSLKVCGRPVRRSKISVLGVSGRKNSKAPPEVLTWKLINLLKKKVRKVQIYDPFFSKKELKDLGLEADTFSKVVENTDCVIILIGHSKFSRLNLRKIRLLTRKTPAIVDLGHILGPRKVEKYGFVYRGLGRGVWTR